MRIKECVFSQYTLKNSGLKGHYACNLLLNSSGNNYMYMIYMMYIIYVYTFSYLYIYLDKYR